MGEEMSEASYEELVQQLTDFNVALTTANGEYRSTYDIMADIAKQWGKMTSMEQAALATAMSGTRQQAVFYSIIEQFQEAEGAMQSMAGSAGELQKSYDIYLESVTAHINEFKAAFQELGSNTFESDFLKQLVDLGTALIEILNHLIEIIDAVGGLNTVLNVTIILLATLNGAKILATLSKVSTLITNVGTDLAMLGSRLLFVIENGGGLSEIFRTLGTSAYTANIAVGLVTAAIIGAISLYKSYKAHLEQVAKQTDQAAESSRNLVKTLEELQAKLANGSESVDTLTEAFKSQLQTMGYTGEQVDDLIEKYHGLAGAINAVSKEAQRQAAADAYKNIKAQRDSITMDTLWDDMFSINMGKLLPEWYGNDLDAMLKVFDSVPNMLERFESIAEILNGSLYPDENSFYDIIELYSQLQALQSDMNKAAYSNPQITSETYYKAVEKAIDRIEDKYLDWINTVKDSSEVIGKYLSDTFSVGLSSEEAELFNNILTSVGASLGNIENAELFAKDLVKDIENLFGSESFRNMQEMAQRVADGTMHINAYAAALEKLRGDYTGGSTFYDAVFQYLEELPGKLRQITASESAAAQAAVDWCSRYNDIPEIVENVGKWADVAAKASKEMAENGEISNDTVKALSELVDEGEDWLQYLTLENGELKLNVELFKERALRDNDEYIRNLEEELSVLQAQSDELLTQVTLKTELREKNSDDIAKAQAAYDELMADFPANPTQYEIGKKQALEGYLNQFYIPDSEYNEVIEHIEEVQKQLEILRNTSRDFDNQVSGASGENSESSKMFNWIEAKLDRIQRKVNEFSRVVGSKFKSLSTRNEAAKKEIEAITEEIELQERAYRKYIELCESVNLSDEIKKTIENGAIDISDYDEETAELISQYQEWYEAALDTKDAVDELHESLASMYDDEFNRIQTDFENRISLLEYLTNMYNTGISQLETEGYMASTEFYKALTESTEHNIDLLKEELGGLESALQAALNSGEIEIYSEAWYGYITTMNGVKEAIADANLSLAEFAKTMQEIDWEYFDYLQERISNITDESEFLLDLLGEDNIFKDGKLTAEGLSALGLRAVNYNVYMAQADKYAQEIAEIEQQLANDPNNKTLLDRREELLELQRQSILAAEDEKNAILDLVETAIEEELDSLKELIEAYKDALDAARDLYQYREKIADETSEIASLQKQIFAYSGDNSEESRATIQQLKDQLVKAQKELEETEYDKYIDDQKKLLDNLYAEYELLLNQRMDNTDALLADIIAMVNQNANVISDTLHMTADSVGYTLSDSLQTVWNTSFSSLQGVVTMYGEGFLSQLTTTNQAINNIANLVAGMQSYSNSWANNWIGGVNNSYVPDYSGWTPGGYDNNVGNNNDVWGSEYVDDEHYPSIPSSPTKQITVGGRINAAGATIYRRSDRSDGGTTQYFGSDPIYTVLSQEQNKYGETMLLVRHHSQSSGNTGWFRMSDVRAYKHGGLVDQTGLVWLDGTKQKPETVLDAEDTKRFQTLVDSMEKFASNGIRMRDIGGVSKLVGRAFDGGRVDINPIRNPGQPIRQEIAINIPIDHVYDYEDFLSQLRSDKEGKRIIQALALDDITGKNSLRVKRYNI